MRDDGSLKRDSGNGWIVRDILDFIKSLNVMTS